MQSEVEALRQEVFHLLTKQVEDAATIRALQEEVATLTEARDRAHDLVRTLRDNASTLEKV